jgi:hypothetical protein
MTLKHSCLFIAGFAILSVVAAFGDASAASSTRSSAVQAHGIQLAQGQPSYNYYNYPVEQVVRPGCYLPSDGCLNEYSVQN